MADIEIQKDPRTHAIIGAAMEVQRHLGRGFFEAVYQEALAVEFGLRNVPFTREVTLPVLYKGHTLACSYRADFVCFDDIVVELKALDTLGPVETAQVLNYLKATGVPVGLLLNFGAEKLDYKRLVLSPNFARLGG